MNSNTQTMAHFFFLSLAFGSQLFAPIVDTKLTGVGFYKLTTSIVLSSIMLAYGVDYFMAPELTAIEHACYVSLIVTNAIGFAFHGDRKTLPMWVIYGLQVCAFSLLTFLSFNYSPTWIPFFISSMLLFGISNFSMLLGHYYLVVPKLSEEPLIYCLCVLWVVIFYKVMGSLSSIFSIGAPYLVEGTTLGDGYVYNWLFISMRYLWGYVAPLILSFFTYRLCRLRSIQSATGVLYIVEFFVIVGELISVYLMTKHGLPL